MGWATVSHFSAVAWLICFATIRSEPSYYNLTGISAIDGKSIVECWQLDTPLFTSPQNGVVGGTAFELGDLANGSYLWLPANFPGTHHPAPANQ